MNCEIYKIIYNENDEYPYTVWLTFNCLIGQSGDLYDLELKHINYQITEIIKVVDMKIGHFGITVKSFIFKDIDEIFKFKLMCGIL